jgi:broad specificity phosphatase PhoE
MAGEEYATPTEIVLVRHGESEGNYAHGRKGDPAIWTIAFMNRHTSLYRLTDKGRYQASVTGKWMQEKMHKSFDAYYTSGFIRAQETAGHMGFEGAEWRQDIYLREIDMGVLTHHSPKEIKELRTYHSHGRESSKHDILYWSPPGGESLADSAMRVDLFLQAIFERHKGKRVLIVCHGNIMRTFKIRLEHMTQFQYSEWSKHQGIANCQVLWYKNSDPKSKEMIHVSSFIPYSIRDPDFVFEWNKIEVPYFSNEQLLRQAEEYEQLVTGTE